MTQEELAEVASFSKRSLQDYESGVTIPYRHLRELGKLLKKAPEWFLYGEDEEPTAITDEAIERFEAAVATFERGVARLEAVADRLEQELPAESESPQNAR